MKSSSSRNWQPDPQLLAAYFDGELDGRPDVADLRARIEAWLDLHPEASVEANDNDRLRQTMLDTSPAEPNAKAWDQTLAHILAAREQPLPRQPADRYWLTACVGAAGIMLVFGLLFGLSRYLEPQSIKSDVAVVPSEEQPKAKPTENMEVLLVAEAHEIVILRIEGADTSAPVVGLLPLHGLLELVAVGDVRVFSMRPAPTDRMVPDVVQEGPNPPVIWARNDAEEDD